MEIITSDEVMDKLDMFQDRFGKVDEFGWWDLEIFSADEGTNFTSTEFQDECQTHSVRLTLKAPDHQEMNGQVKATRRTLHTTVHSRMVHGRVLEAYIHFVLKYTAYHIFPVLSIKYLINEDS